MCVQTCLATPSGLLESGNSPFVMLTLHFQIPLAENQIQYWGWADKSYWAVFPHVSYNLHNDIYPLQSHYHTISSALSEIVISFLVQGTQDSLTFTL